MTNQQRVRRALRSRLAAISFVLLVCGLGWPSVAASASSPALVEARIESNVESINENRPGEVALVITNPRDTELRVDAIDVTAPNQVDISLFCPSGAIPSVAGGTRSSARCRFSVQANSQEVLRLSLETGGTVTPGPRALLLKIQASGGGTSASVVATTAFDVDIFAESDILKAVGVPIFLLLPGVIIVLVSWFLIREASPWRRLARDQKTSGSISIAAVTAILGVGVSLLIAPLYPTLTDFLPGTSRDYLRAYGFRDFYYVFGWSFAIAGAVWVVACIAYLFAPLARWLFIPMPGDKATDLLRKVGLRGIFGGDAVFEKVSIDESEKGGLRLGGRPGETVLVAPAVLAKVEAKAPEGLRDEIETAARENRAYRLSRIVQQAVAAKSATIGYRTADLSEPQLVERSKVHPTGNKVPVVMVTST